MKLIRWILLATMLSAGATGSALAQTQAPLGDTPGSARHEESPASLTPAQTENIAALRAQAATRAAPLCQQLATKEKELQALWAADHPDRLAILSKDAEIETVRRELRQIQTDFGFQAHDILTPRQWQDWVRSDTGLGATSGQEQQSGRPSDTGK